VDTTSNDGVHLHNKNKTKNLVLINFKGGTYNCIFDWQLEQMRKVRCNSSKRQEQTCGIFSKATAAM
jgi:hypothetical protein